MLCPQCETKNDEDANYCKHCGFGLRAGDNISIGGSTGPGSVTGSGSVRAGRDIIGELHKHYNTDNELELERVLRERLFTKGVYRNRDDVERWVAWYRAQDKSPDLFRARLSRLKLEGIDLICANLCEADMRRAHLRRAKLTKADLSEANLFKADLCMADLSNAGLFLTRLCGADLQNAILIEANLYGANMLMVNLREADLRWAHLDRVNFCGVDLRGADLYMAALGVINCDEHTILPDGKNWTPDADLESFTGKRMMYYL